MTAVVTFMLGGPHAVAQNDAAALNLPPGHPAVVPGAVAPPLDSSTSTAMPATDQRQRALLDQWSDTFAQNVDISALGSIAVQFDGRIKSFDSHAAQIMQQITGPRRIDDQSRIFTYLDLIFRPQRYEDAPIIYVKKKQVRQTIIDELHRDVSLSQNDRAA
jgi:hypothetical protein